MGKVFVNLSNHASVNWQKEQREAAEKYGEIVDVPFPYVSSLFSEADIDAIGKETVKKITEMDPTAVMCQGEFTLTYRIVTELLKKGIPCVAACTERIAREIVSEDGTILKTSEFRFVRFRNYDL